MDIYQQRWEYAKALAAWLTGKTNVHPCGQAGKSVIINNHEDGKIHFLDCDNDYGSCAKDEAEVLTHKTYSVVKLQSKRRQDRSRQ